MKIDNYFMTSLLPLWMFHDQMYIVNFGHYHANKFHILTYHYLLEQQHIKNVDLYFWTIFISIFLIIKKVLIIKKYHLFGVFWDIFPLAILGMLQHTRKDVLPTTLTFIYCVLKFWILIEVMWILNLILSCIGIIYLFATVPPC